jgi:adenosylmethionine---8-amino-7-oxononanoate aminotransferase
MTNHVKKPAPLTPEEVRELVQEDHRHLWHPFTQMQEWVEQPCLIVAAGEGSYLIDVEGNRYLDGVSSLWVTVHGHGRREINEAIRDQLDRVAHSTLLGLANVPAIELARKLAEISPRGLSRVFYSDNGSTAVEVCLKIAYQFQRQRPDLVRRDKRQIVSFHNAYHGDTLGAVSVGGIDQFHACYRDLLFPSLKVHYPYCYRCHLGRSYPSCGQACLEEIETLFEREGHTIAALIVEPLVQAAGGMIVAPPGYLKSVERLCRKHEVLLIADEVAVGWGRTGTLFAVEQEDVAPDLMALAKGITGGYLPLAVSLVTEPIFEAFVGEYVEGKTFFHGHTYTGNPLAARAALASLEIFDKDRTLENLQPKIRHLAGRLEQFRGLDHVGDVRQCGFLAGIELVRDQASREPYPVGERRGMRVTLEARRHGLIIRPLGDVVVIMPPLSMSLPELDRMMDVIYDSIRSVTSPAIEKRPSAASHSFRGTAACMK